MVNLELDCEKLALKVKNWDTSPSKTSPAACLLSKNAIFYIIKRVLTSGNDLQSNVSPALCNKLQRQNDFVIFFIFQKNNGNWVDNRVNILLLCALIFEMYLCAFKVHTTDFPGNYPDFDDTWNMPKFKKVNCW